MSSAITNASFFFSSVILTFKFLAGLNALAINSSGSSLYAIKSIFSPPSSLIILAILLPFSPIQLPTGSTLGFVDATATLLLTPASLATPLNSKVPSANSGISCSNSLFTNP